MKKLKKKSYFASKNKKLTISIVLIFVFVIVSVFIVSYLARQQSISGIIGERFWPSKVTKTTTIFIQECITDEDCKPKKFLWESVGKFFICEQGRCKTEEREIEYIPCKIFDDSCIPCQTDEECPHGFECSEGICWGPE